MENESDVIISALADMPTGPLAGFVKLLTAEPSAILQALRHTCYQELSFRNGTAMRPRKFELPAATERELLVAGLAATDAAEVLPDGPGCNLWLAVARLCGEHAEAIRAAGRAAGAAN